MTDQSALRQRLHDELDQAKIGLAPVDAVFRRYRAARSRRAAAVVISLTVAAVTAGAIAVRGAGQPRLDRTPGAPGGAVFASGRTWQLAAVDLAAPGHRCLPGVVYSGRAGDLLQGAIPPGLPLGDAGFLALRPGTPDSGIAFLRLRAGVHDLAASLGDGTVLALTPRSVTLCGQRFRLAGFMFPAQGVRQITARSGSGRAISFRPDPYLFAPTSNLLSEGWFNYQALAGDAAAGPIGSGSIHGTAWRARVTLGSNGECFWIGVGPGNGSNVSICAPIGVPPRTASLQPLGFAEYPGVLEWFLGTVNIGTAYAAAHLSDGTTVRITPAVVGGRKYVAVGFATPVRLISLTLYDTAGRMLARIANIPPVG